MSSKKPSGRLLIIDQDTLLLQTLRQHFETEAYQIYSAETCQAGMELTRTARPHLILLATEMVDMSGLEAFRILRDTPRTNHIPVMMLAGRSETTLQKDALKEGVYDFIVKPLDLDILMLRVRNALRRAEREGLTEPRTGLPTDRLITERLDAIKDTSDWYQIDLTIDSFDVFRDLYGFVTANEALIFAGNLVMQLVNEHGSPDDFVGHALGTETFTILTTGAIGPPLRKILAQHVTPKLQAFYNFVERDQGYVQLEDGAGGRTKKPLMSAKIRATINGVDDTQADEIENEANDHDQPAADSSGSVFEW